MAESHCDCWPQWRGVRRTVEKALRRARGNSDFRANRPFRACGGQLLIVSEGPRSNRVPGQLWRAAKAAGGARGLAERPCPSPYVLQCRCAYQLANAISADSAKDSELGRTSSSYASELGLLAEVCDSIGPREMLRMLRSEQISQFPQAGTQLNLPRNCGAGLKSAAAGICCWGCFCDVTTRRHVPPTEGGVHA